MAQRRELLREFMDQFFNEHCSDEEMHPDLAERLAELQKELPRPYYMEVESMTNWGFWKGREAGFALGMAFAKDPAAFVLTQPDEAPKPTN